MNWLQTMEDVHRYTDQQSMMSSLNLQWFYSKSKVSISLAIPEISPLLKRLTEAQILSELESLELQGDTRSVHRVIYECLCWIEEKNISLQLFFDTLFYKPFLRENPKLKPVFNEYRRGKFRNGILFPSDQENMDKDLIIFAQEKAKICLAITDLFPFLHGLQDLTVLSETESLRLQADGRPVSRVIYECLSLIEKKDLKLNVVFEYIFQECYQNLYPGLQVILRESIMDQPGPFKRMQCSAISNPDSLIICYEANKHNISASITDRFPFLHGLCDIGLLSRIELLKLQADKRKNNEVIYTALSLIRRSDIQVLLSYVFREQYLTCFPGLNIILKRLNKVLKLNICSPTSDVENIMMDQVRTCRLKPVCYTELSEHDCELVQDQKGQTGLSPRSSFKGRWKDSLQEKLGMRRHKKIRARILNNGALVSAIKQECTRGLSPRSSFKGRWKDSLQRKLGMRQHKKIRARILSNGALVSAIKQECTRASSKLVVKLEFPKQLFDNEFQVTCGQKTGIFMKKYWSGDPRNDRCIKCDSQMFTVIKFEKYGGRAASKSWKKSIRCAHITMETLFQSLVLKTPYNLKVRL